MLEWKRQSHGKSMVLVCDNFTHAKHTIDINFNELNKFTNVVLTPIRRVVKPGRTQILKLNQLDKPFGGRIQWYVSKGCATQFPDTSVVYLLPVAPGKTTSITSIHTINEDTKEITAEEDYYAMAFTMTRGDTVFSARKGVVTEVGNELNQGYVSNTASDNPLNTLEIMHDDCSFANYWSFKKGEVFVKVGQRVEAGTPLGIIESDAFDEGTQLRFHVRYNNVRQKETIGLDRLREPVLFVNNSWGYVKSIFWTLQDGATLLEDELIYKSEHPDELVIQEMNKRQTKRFLNN
ncbi:MAG: M23 family metallopeptidase [Bacteroidota bacterium]